MLGNFLFVVLNIRLQVLDKLFRCLKSSGNLASALRVIERLPSPAAPILVGCGR